MGGDWGQHLDFGEPHFLVAFIIFPPRPLPRMPLQPLTKKQKIGLGIEHGMGLVTRESLLDAQLNIDPLCGSLFKLLTAGNPAHC